YLVLTRLRPHASSVRFLGSDDELIVARNGGSFTLEMPALRPRTIERPPTLAQRLGLEPKAVLAAKHYLCIFDRPDEIAAIAPDMRAIATLDLPAVIVTAPAAGDVDFVSRF